MNRKRALAIFNQSRVKDESVFSSLVLSAPQSDGQEVASVVSAQEIRVVAELLQISPEGLQKAVTYKVTVSIKMLYVRLCVC